MKILTQKNLIVSGLLICLLNSQLTLAQNEEEYTYRLIISSSMFQNAKTEDVEASTRILAAELKKDSKIPSKFDISVCKSKDELIAEMKLPFDMLYISPVEFLQLKKTFNIEPALISEINNNFGDVYYLVTNKSDNKTSLKNLEAGIINILSNADNQAPTLWLDKLLKENNLPKKSKFFKQVVLDYKTNNVLLPVFFKKAAAAIVTNSAYDLICELNPKIKQETEIILKSGPMLRAIFCFDGRNKDTERKNFLSDYMQNLHKNNHGKQVLSLYLVNRLIPFKQEYLENILDLYK